MQRPSIATGLEPGPKKEAPFHLDLHSLIITPPIPTFPDILQAQLASVISNVPILWIKLSRFFIISGRWWLTVNQWGHTMTAQLSAIKTPIALPLKWTTHLVVERYITDGNMIRAEDRLLLGYQSVWRRYRQTGALKQGYTDWTWLKSITKHYLKCVKVKYLTIWCKEITAWKQHCCYLILQSFCSSVWWHFIALKLQTSPFILV